MRSPSWDLADERLEGVPHACKESTEGSKEKKESKPSEGKRSGNLKISADEIRKLRLLAKLLKEQATNTNPRKAPRLLNRISEETVRAGVYE